MSRKLTIILQKAAIMTTTILLALMLAGSVIAFENAAQVNGALGTANYKLVEIEKEGSEDDGRVIKEEYEYYKSSYFDPDNPNKNNLLDLIADAQEKCEEAMGEGAALLKNENNALPFTSGNRKVSFFSISCVDPAYGGTGSGLINTATAPTWKQAFERNSLFSVNDTLWNFYAGSGNTYKRTTGSTGPGVSGIKTMGEAPWATVDAAAGNSFGSFGDAAIFFLARLGGEGSDMPRGNRSLSMLDNLAGDSTDRDYLKLSPKEIGVLEGLKQKKDSNVFKKIIVIINSSNQVEADFLTDPAYGIDAALYIGTPGQTGMYAVADILAGNINPSGRLSDTFWKKHSENPTMANFGTFLYEGAEKYSSGSTPHQDNHYVVYQEGIYLGYKYTETRYEDYVMGTGKTGIFKYADTVTYPFGYGKSYSTFEYSNFNVSRSGSGANAKYTVSVDVTNKGPYAGKETVQVYLQKAYADYNKKYDVEAAAVEIAGFGKTGILAKDAKETITIEVDERQFASYDSNNKKTYVLTAGDYYLTAAKDAHDAVNNILAKKNFTPVGTQSKMDAAGNANMVSAKITLSEQLELYSKSAATGQKITNQFDEADWNKYKNRGSDKVTYMTREDWAGTVPKNADDYVKLTWSQQLKDDQDAFGRQGETKTPIDKSAYPTYGKDAGLKLIDMRADDQKNKIPYDDPLWDVFLDQLTWKDMADLIPTGMRMSGAIGSIAKPQNIDHNGPSGLTQPYLDNYSNNRGLAARYHKAGIYATTQGTSNPATGDYALRPICYPAGGIMSGTFNTGLMYEVGEMIGEDALWAGYNGLYGPGPNIHRTPYAGRNFEYYSEDGFLTGRINAYEVAAMENKGMYVYNKHCGLNDQEDLRRGVGTWSNEQAVREIYMRAFEIPITIDGTKHTLKNGTEVTLKGASGVMTAFNRIGLHWAGMQKGHLTGFLRNECGMKGIIVTDMWYGTASPYMNLPYMLLAGGNLVDGAMSPDDLNASKADHADVAWAMRESLHRILYATVQSNAMNGISPDTLVVRVTPWWQILLIGLDIGLGVLLAASVTWMAVGYVFYRKKNI